LDFANETYVRLYTRDTTTWKRLLFNGQTVLMHVLRKLDFAGVLDLEDMQPWEAAVLHCGIPEDIARDGMARCLDRGVLVHRGHFLVAPRYRDANEATKSDRQRQLESRARRRSRALDETVTESDHESRPVTRGHACSSQNGTSASRIVTNHHERSHRVTRTDSVTDTDAGAGSERPVTSSPNGNGRGPTAAAPNGSMRVSGQDAANVWSRVVAMPGGHPIAAHAYSHHAKHFDLIASACNAVVLENAASKPAIALQAVTEWFWHAPEGPVQAGRVSRAAATPKLLATGITEDLDRASTWWLARKQAQQQQPEPHEAAQ
jgi:hypothetical protein